MTLTVTNKLADYLDLEFTRGPVFAHYMLNHELDVLFAEQIDPSDNVVSPYIEAMLAGDGDPQ